MQNTTTRGLMIGKCLSCTEYPSWCPFIHALAKRGVTTRRIPTGRMFMSKRSAYSAGSGEASSKRNTLSISASVALIVICKASSRGKGNHNELQSCEQGKMQ